LRVDAGNGSKRRIVGCKRPRKQLHQRKKRAFRKNGPIKEQNLPMKRLSTEKGKHDFRNSSKLVKE